MREYREPENSELMTYGKPPVSAWIAVAAVAFSFIVLGGFIHAYRQLEQLRKESRREIEKLRQATGRLQAQLDAARFSHRQQVPNASAPVPPPASRWLEEQAPGIEKSWDADVELSPPAERAGTDGGRVRARFGRSSADEGLGRLWESEPCRVVSVDMERKRLIIDGGRDRMLREGMGVELSRGQSYIADARIVTVHANQSVCEIGVARADPAPEDLVRIPRESSGFGRP